MKLSDAEKKVLSALSAIGDGSIPKIAKEAGLREHAARYALTNLLSKKVLNFFPCINSGALGYSAYSLYFSLGPGKVRAKETFLQKLIEHDHVSWVAHLGGDFDYAVTFQAKGSNEFVKFVDEFSSFPGVELTQKAVRIDALLRHYPLKAFRKGKKQVGVDIWCGESTTMSADLTDSKILSRLCNSGLSREMDLARELKMPVTTLRSRIEKLEKANVITGRVYFLTPKAAGLRTFKLRILAKGVTSDFLKRFEAFCHEAQHVSLFVRSLGAWDFEVNVDVVDAEEVNGVIEHLHDEFPDNIRDIRKGEIFTHLKAKDFPFKF
jgi:DNA-binding Lrp family transcriptional regulator